MTSSTSRGAGRPPRSGKHLLEAHHGHFVPLFRLETHLLTRLAGSLEAIPDVLSVASYATLVLAMAAVGHLVASEAGRVASGLVAMAAVGLSTVLGPAVLWYSAGQAMAAGTMVILMLIALQSWRISGTRWAFGMALLAAIAERLIWSGGFAAGPVGLAYLWADGRREARRASPWLLITTLVVAGLAWFLAGGDFARRRTSPTRRSGRSSRSGSSSPTRRRRSARRSSSTTSASTPRPPPARPWSSARCSPPCGGGRDVRAGRLMRGPGRGSTQWRPPGPRWCSPPSG